MKNIFKYILVIQFSTQSLFAAEKNSGGVKRLNENDNLTPAEQAKQNKIKKDSCIDQGKVWASGDGVSKKWDCYDPEALKSKVKLEADPSCDETFIKKLIAQDGCVINGNASDCIYMGSLASMGLLGAKSGYDALFQLSNAKNSAFLKNYQKIYEKGLENKIKYEKILNLVEKADVLASQKLYKSLFAANPPPQEAKETDYIYARRLEQARRDYLDQLSQENKTLPRTKYYTATYPSGEKAPLEDAHKDAMLELTQKDPDLHKLIEKTGYRGHWRDYVVIRGELNQSVQALTQELFPNEYNDLNSIVKKYNARSDSEIAQNTSTEVKKMAEIESNIKKLASKLKAINDNDLVNRIKELEAEKRDLLRHIVAKEAIIRDRWHEVLLKELREKYPQHYMLEALRPHRWFSDQFTQIVTERRRSVEDKALKDPAKSGMRGAVAVSTASLGLGVAGVPILNTVSESQLNLCSKSLNLSTEEINLLYEDKGLFKGSPKNVKKGRLSDCQSFILTNVSDVLTKAQAQFGYIPKGICQMAQKLNQKQELITQGTQPKEVSCNNVKGDNYSLNLDANGNGKLVCTSSTKKMYNIPYNLYKGADYSKVSALNINGERDDLSADTFRELAGGEKYKYVAMGKTQFMPTRQSTISDCLESEGSVSRSNNRNIFCSCVIQAQAAQAILQVMKANYSCSRVIDSSSNPASINDETSNSKTQGVR